MKTEEQDTVTTSHASLYMTYTMSLQINDLAKSDVSVNIRKLARELNVSEDVIIISWLEEMSALHK